MILLILILCVVCGVAYCGHISPDWRASAEEAELIFINAGVECLFMFEGE